MPGLIAKRPGAVATAVWLLCLILVSLWLYRPDSHLGGSLVRASYDVSHAFAQGYRPLTADSPVVLVYLDFESYGQERQDPAAPWNRALHAQLIRRLTRAGARAILFDIIFDRPGPDANADRELREAIQSSGRVILAGELVPSGHQPGDSVGTKTRVLTQPDERFRGVAAGWGLANVIVDPDFTVRRHFSGFDPARQPSLSWRVAQLLDLPAVHRPGGPGWIHYYGPALTVPYVSYTHALRPAAVADEFFRNRTVVIGARPFTGGFTERRDEFRSPFAVWKGDLFMPAVEIHATQLLNLIRNDGLRRFGSGVEQVVLAAFAILVSLGLVRFRPLAATGVALATAAGLAGAATALFVLGRVWFPWLLVVSVQLPLAWVGTVAYRSVEWYRARRRLEAIRKAAEAKIREQAALLDKAQDAILVQELDGQIIYANPSAERLFGWPLQKGGGLDAALARQLFSPSLSRCTTAQRAVLDRGEWQGELELATRAGEKLLVESRWTLITDPGGAAKSILLINTDITDKKRIETQFLRAQRLEAIWSLAGGMAHDLNNALSPVLMGIQRLRKKLPDEELQKMLAIMESNTHRGADMVKQVLTFSRGHSEERELLNPGQLLHELGRVVGQTFPKSISVGILAPTDLWPVLGNSTQLHQVLLNLGVNARDAMPRGGELTLAADNVTFSAEEAKEIPGAFPGEFVMLLVADTGTGIPPAVMARLFEPFFTTKEPGYGTGLGLSTSAHIVRGHGGFLHVKSEEGAGTTFEIYLPRATTELASPAAAVSAEIPRGHGELILLIDDELALLGMIDSTLTEHGYEVLSAASGAEGLKFVDQHGPKIRLALVDTGLPGMDGRAVIAAIRRQLPSLPVIVMSGNARPAAEGESDDASSFLAKPFRVDELLTLLHEKLKPPCP